MELKISFTCFKIRNQNTTILLVISSSCMNTKNCDTRRILEKRGGKKAKARPQRQLHPKTLSINLATPMTDNIVLTTCF